MTVVTSKPSPVQIGQGRNKETIYTATRTTKLADGTYSVEMLQYSNAKGQGGKVIAERDSVNEWTFKDGVSKKIKQNEGRLNSASKNQMESMRGDFVTKSQEAEAYNSANGNRKTAPDPPETGDNSRPSGAIKADAKTRDSFPTGLRYPVDMAEAQDVIKFDMLKYEPKKVSGFGFSERNSDRASIGSVILPIPGGISDANACDWGGDTMNPLQIAGAAIALGALGSDAVPGGLGGAFGDLKNQVVDNNPAVKGAIAGGAAASAIGSDINSLLGRTQGVILNPNLELLFQRPSLRPFSFEFKMSPRSSAEAARIVEIIRFFKQGMAPIRDESRLFLKTPHTFRIKYVQQGEDSKFLNRFKECALLSCNVQYTPEGNYAPYEDGAMSSYAMSLQFKELEPVYNDEYSEFDDTNIGF
tara:strand:+ start:55 stop:1299 length:1245 start_codon:yes stop_codon:yes gene_type:complete